MIFPAKLTGVQVTPLDQIRTPGGDVLRGLRTDEDSFNGFGEMYFSYVQNGFTKGWKKHKSMTLNIVVPVGAIEFMVLKSGGSAEVENAYMRILLSRDNYCRLTVAPGLWVAFKGVGKELNMLVNFADMIHDPNEVERQDLSAFDLKWQH